LDGIYALEIVDNMKCRSCNNRSAIFMTVPAAATSTMSHRGAWSELKLIVTGLACQKEMARGTTAENRAIGIVPDRSMCLSWIEADPTDGSAARHLSSGLTAIGPLIELS
jgi:hypothetical protein